MSEWNSCTQSSNIDIPVLTVPPVPLNGWTAVYVINDFSLAGAERGLISLLRQGLFNGAEIHIVGLLRGSGRLLPELAELKQVSGVHILVNEETFSIGRLVRAYFSLRKMLTELAPDVVVSSLPQASMVTRLALLRSPRTMLCSFEHSTRLSHLIYYPLLLALSWRTDVILADCKTTLRTMRRRTYLPGQYRSLEMPLFVSNSFALEKAKPQPPIKIFSVGRLVPLKRVDLVLKALARVSDRIPAFEYHVFGDGPTLGRLKYLTEELNLTERVYFHGFVRDWQIRAVHFDIFAHVSDYEGLSLVTLEAMMLGTAVLVSASGGICEYAQHLNNAYILDAISVDHISKALITLADNHELRQSMACRARSEVGRRFSAERLRRRIDRLHRLLRATAR